MSDGVSEARGMSRRRFIATAAVAGASVAVAGATGCAAEPRANKVPVATPSSDYGRDHKMGKRILVGYATGTGTTTGVAEAIGKTLGERGFSVDVRPMKERPSCDGYDAVVLGSAINGGQWLPEAVSYLEANGRPLASTPVALFCVHGMNTGPEPKKVERRHAYLDKERAVVAPVAEGYFAGKGPVPDEAGWFARKMYRVFGGDVEGDGRDWVAIRAWAEALPV